MGLDQGRQLAMAAVDPMRAMTVPADVITYTDDDGRQIVERYDQRHELVPIEDRPTHVPGTTMAVIVDPPAKHSRWRFFIFWCLVKLAAKVYPFKFELYRTPRLGEEE
jgi:hypothetical protein